LASTVALIFESLSFDVKTRECQLFHWKPTGQLVLTFVAPILSDVRPRAPVLAAPQR
jgi:hypothetical protein